MHNDLTSLKQTCCDIAIQHMNDMFVDAVGDCFLLKDKAREYINLFAGLLDYQEHDETLA